MPILVEIALDPNNHHQLENVMNGLALTLEGSHGLSVRVTGRRQDWVSLVHRLVSWGVVKVELKEPEIDAG